MDNLTPARITTWPWIIAEIIVILAVTAMGFVIRAIPAWTAFEYDVLNTISAHHTPVGDAFALGMSWLFGPLIGSILVVIAAGAIALVTRRVMVAALMVGIVALPWIGAILMKFAVQRPRPDVLGLAAPLTGQPADFGYPSGHTAFATAFTLALLITVGSGRWRAAWIAVAIVVPLLMAGCRVYLGVHYPSDVIAALVYAVAAVGLVCAVAGRRALRSGRSVESHAG